MLSELTFGYMLVAMAKLGFYWFKNEHFSWFWIWSIESTTNLSFLTCLSTCSNSSLVVPISVAYRFQRQSLLFGILFRSCAVCVLLDHLKSTPILQLVTHDCDKCMFFCRMRH